MHSVSVSPSPQVRKSPVCTRCGGSLRPGHRCTRALLRCVRCQSVYGLEDFADLIEDDWEEFYANIPVNRM